jgi:hypothetical protein
LKIEVLPRFDFETQNRLIVQMTNNDNEKITDLRSRLNLVQLLDECHKLNIKTLVIGTTPRFPNEENQIAQRNNYYAQVCDRRNVQFIDIFSPLIRNQQWMTSSLSTNYKYPDQIGYELIAWIVLHSEWNIFLDLPKD